MPWPSQYLSPVFTIFFPLILDYTFIWMQVFPMLMEKFTCEEQSQLVWQYMCSVPFMLLEDFLPWTAHHLSSNEKPDLEHCIKLIMPKETLLQEVVP